MDKDTRIFKIVLFGIGLYFIYRFAQKIGVVKDESDIKSEELENASFWTADFYRNAAKKGYEPLILTASRSRQLVNDLWDAKGVFNDNEEAVYGIFRSLSTKSQVSFLSERFYNIKGKDLIQWLNGFLSTEELAKIYNIVQKLPKYKR